MNPLQEATTDELLDELGRRHTAALFVGEKPTPGEANETTTFLKYSGGLNTAMGMAYRALKTLEADGLLGDMDDDEDADNGH